MSQMNGSTHFRNCLSIIAFFNIEYCTGADLLLKIIKSFFSEWNFALFPNIKLHTSMINLQPLM